MGERKGGVERSEAPPSRASPPARLPALALGCEGGGGAGRGCARRGGRTAAAEGIADGASRSGQRGVRRGREMGGAEVAGGTR